jgi:hypothetical protein
MIMLSAKTCNVQHAHRFERVDIVFSTTDVSLKLQIGNKF